MQQTSTICDVCFDTGANQTPGHTLDLSWLRDGFEIDICEKHAAELNAERDRLATIWLQSARRTYRKSTKPDLTTPASGEEFVPGLGVEGVDWVWGRGRKRRQKVVNTTCETCGRSFNTQASYSQHVRAHDPAVAERNATNLNRANDKRRDKAQEGSHDHADIL